MMRVMKKKMSNTDNSLLHSTISCIQPKWVTNGGRAALFAWETNPDWRKQAENATHNYYRYFLLHTAQRLYNMDF